MRRISYLMVFLVAGCGQPTPGPAPHPIPAPIPAPAPVEVIQQLLDAHNKVRAEHQLQPLKLNSRLVMAAGKHSRYMAGVQQMAHTGIGDGTPWGRIVAEGYHYSAMGENVAWGQVSVERVMTAWMNSPGHRANILGKYAEFGGDLAKAVDGSVYWTTDFGTPGAAMSAQSVAPGDVRLIPPVAVEAPQQ